MRRLSPDERLLWNRVVESVRPLHAFAPPDAVDEAPPPAPAQPGKKPPKAAPLKVASTAPKGVGVTLDGTWDRRLSRGLVQPDMVLDLHGHDLARAYDLLDARLEAAIAAGARILLLITGKAPGGERPVARGRIRAAVGDWLAASRHSERIAAVRGAHPRHGGAGALYIVLRRVKA